MKKFIALTLTVMFILLGVSTANAWVVRAKNVKPDTGSFDGHLSSADNTLQKALDTLDDITAGGDITGVGDAASGAALDGSSDGGTYIRLYDGSAHYTEIQGPSVAGNTTFTLPGYTATGPATDGSAGQFIKTDGSGTWSFATAAGGGTVTTLQEGDVDVDANADPNDVVTLDFGTGFALAESPNTEVNVTLDVAPDSGSATLVVEEDSIQVKFDTTDFKESTNGLYLGDNPTIATSLAFGAEAADAGALRLSNATDIVWEHSTPGTDIVALGVDASQIVQIAASGSAGVTITPAVTLSSTLTDGTATLNSGAWSAISTLAMTGALSGPTSVTITAAAPVLTLADSTASAAGTMDFKADAVTATYDAIMRFYVDDDTGEDNLYMTIDGTNEEILFAENLDLTSTGIENVGNIADDAAFSIISASGAVTIESVVFTGGALTGVTHSDGLTIGDGGSSHYITVSDTGGMTFTGNADINLPDDSVDIADIGTDQVTMDAIDADGNFTSLTGNWTTTGALGAGDTTITSADPILILVDSTSADGTATLSFAATGSNESVAEIQVDEAGSATTYIELDGINTDVEIKKALVTSSTSDLSAGNVTLGVVVGTIDAGGATSLEIPSGTSGTTNATGEVYLDTDGPDADYTGPVVQISTNDATLGYLFTLTDAPAAADDNKIIKYDAATNLFSLEADADSGSPLYNSIGDPDAAGEITFQDEEDNVWITEEADGDFFEIRATQAFGDFSIMKIVQITGDPTDGALLELQVADGEDHVDQLMLVNGPGAPAEDYATFRLIDAGTLTIDVVSDGTAGVTFPDPVTFSSATVLAADSVDAITEIKSTLKSGADVTLVTGTAGTDTYTAVWNADGDIVDGFDPATYVLIESINTAAELESVANLGAFFSDYADDANAAAMLVTLGINATEAEIDTPLDGASVTLTEFQELEAIGETTISAGQWGYLGAADQAIATTDTVTFSTVTVTTEVYGAGWDGDNTVPTKDATYDKIQAIAGDITDVGPGFATGAAFTDGVVSTGTQMLVWEGTTADGVEFIIVGPEDPSTSDSTVTFREASGTVLISGDTLTGHATATFDTDGSTATTVVDFALNTDADAGDIDILSVDKLEGIDNAVFLDLGGDGIAELQADTKIQLDSPDVIQYEAQNDGNPEYRMGSADAEEGIIQIVYDSGAQGVDYLLIQTQTADATADEGRIIFSVDEATIATIDDGGIELGISKIISGTTRVTIGDNNQEIVINSSDWDIDETGAITGVSFADILDVDEEVDIDFDNADEEVIITNSAEYGANGAQVTIENSDADVGAQMYLLDLDYTTDDDQALADYIIAQDSGGEVFRLAQNGDIITQGSVDIVGSAGLILENDETITNSANGTVLITGILDLASAGITNVGAIADDAAITLISSGGAVTVEGVIFTGNDITTVAGIDGSGTISANLFAPDGQDGADIGSTSLEFSDIYLADGSIIKFGDDQDVTLTHVADTGLDINLAFGILDDKSLIFGTNDDWTVIYDETTDDRLEIVNIAGTSGDSDVYWDLNDDGADSTFTITNSDATYEANLTVQGSITSTSTGDSYLQLNNNASIAAANNRLYFEGNELKVSENSNEEVVLTQEDGATLTGATWDFSGTTNFKLPAAADANSEIAIDNSDFSFIVYVNSTSIEWDFNETALDDGDVMVWSSGNSQFEPTAGAVTDVSLDDLDDPDAGQPSVFTFNADNEEVTFDYTAAFTTAAAPDLFKIIQQTGNTEAVTLFTLQAADSDVTVFEAGNGTSNAVLISQVGGMTFAGTAGVEPLPITTNTTDIGSTTREYDNLYLGDAGIIALGSDQDVTLTHVADTGIQLELDDKIMFYDTAVYIHSDDDGYLDIEADTAIRMDGPVDMQANALDCDSNTVTLSTIAGTLSDGTASWATATQTLAGFASITSTVFASGADPADAGAIRLSNADDIMWEASGAGTDINALTVDASEVVQIGSAGASGVTITPALTLSSTLTDGTATLNSGAWSGISTLAMTGALSGLTTIAPTDDVTIADTKSIKTGASASDYFSIETTDDVGDTPVQVEAMRVTVSGDADAALVEIGDTGAVSPKIVTYLQAGPDAMANEGYNGTVITGLNAGEAIDQGNLVYWDATETEWMEADANDAGHWPARGVALATGSNGNPLDVLVQGIMRHDDWAQAFTVGGPVYLSITITDNEGVTATAPSTAGECVQVVGWALTVDEVYFNFSGHYLEVE